MNSTIHVGKVIQGGIVAGLLINALSIVNNVAFLGGRYAVEQQAGHLQMEARIPFLPIWIVEMFLVGIGLVWLYAAVRPRLGPGPRTALTVGLIVGLIAGVPGATSQAAWSTYGKFLPFMWMLETVVGSMLGTLVGAWVYKEGASAAS